MTVFDKIIQLLQEHHVTDYQIIDHERVHTCEDAAKIRGTSPDQGAKALVCYADSKPILIVLPCSSKLDFKAFKKWQYLKDLRFATPQEVTQLTTLEIGSIPPLGPVLNLPTYVDHQLLQQQQICYNAGLHHRSIMMSVDDYVKVADSIAGSFSLNAY
jgi:Ala-tRNA(Pro) deacylase